MHAKLRNLGLIVLCCFVAVILVYGRVPILYLRCESGEWLRLAHMPSQAQRSLIAQFWTSSSHGHYTPLAFTGEFLFTKFADTNQSLWRARQLTAVTLLAVCFFVFVRTLALVSSISNRAANGVAAGLSAAFIFQPPMKDLVAWPFHIFQLIWMILMLMTMTALLALLIRPAPKWVWISAATSYASMHALGLGLVTWSGSVVILSVLLAGACTDRLPAYRHLRRTLSWALGALFFAGIVQALCMAFLLGPRRTALAQTADFQWLHALGLVAVYPMSVVMNFFGILPTAFDGIPYVTESAAPYGLLVILAALAWLVALARSAFSGGPQKSLLHFCLHAFSFVSFVAFIGMFAAREAFEIGALDIDIYKFFVDSRYVVPFSLTLMGSVLWLLFRLVRGRQRFAAAFFVALGCAAFFANLRFQHQVSPRVLAFNSISHARAWNFIVATGQECRAAGLLIPDIPMGNLITFSPQTRLSYFEPILHDALQMPPQERCEFIPWENSRGAAREKYDRAVPSLQRVTDLLRLN